MTAPKSGKSQTQAQASYWAFTRLSSKFPEGTLNTRMISRRRRCVRSGVRGGLSRRETKVRNWPITTQVAATFSLVSPPWSRPRPRFGLVRRGGGVAAPVERQSAEAGDSGQSGKPQPSVAGATQTAGSALRSGRRECGQGLVSSSDHWPAEGPSPASATSLVLRRVQQFARYPRVGGARPISPPAFDSAPEFCEVWP